MPFERRLEVALLGSFFCSVGGTGMLYMQGEFGECPQGQRTILQTPLSADHKYCRGHEILTHPDRIRFEPLAEGLER